MRVTKWTTVDVLYNPGEEYLAIKERKRLERLGYELQEECEGTDNYEFDDQYIKSGRPRMIKQKGNNQ